MPAPQTVSVIGLDDFGSLIARTLLEHGFEVSGLDPLRSLPLAPAEGLKLLCNLEQAVEASEALIVCFPDQLLMNARLCNPETTFGLHGKALISFNTRPTRSAASARSMGEWARSEQIDYLEVRLSDSADAGQGGFQLLCSGPLRAFNRLKPLCQALGASVTYLGNDCGATLDH